MVQLRDKNNYKRLKKKNSKKAESIVSKIFISFLFSTTIIKILTDRKN